jgi:hypothetical protein
MRLELRQVGPCGLVVNRAAHRGRSEQCALRPAQHRDIVNIKRVNVRDTGRVERVGQRHVVYEIAGGALGLRDARGGRYAANDRGGVAG